MLFDMKLPTLLQLLSSFQCFSQFDTAHISQLVKDQIKFLYLATVSKKIISSIPKANLKNYIFI